MFLKGSCGPVFLWSWLLWCAFLITGVVAGYQSTSHLSGLVGAAPTVHIPEAAGWFPPCIVRDGVQCSVNLKHLEVSSSLV